MENREFSDSVFHSLLLERWDGEDEINLLSACSRNGVVTQAAGDGGNSFRGLLSMGKSHDQSDGESVEHVSGQLRQASRGASLVIPRHGVVLHNQNRHQQHHYDAVEPAQKQAGESIEWQR